MNPSCVEVFADFLEASTALLVATLDPSKVRCCFLLRSFFEVVRSKRLAEDEAEVEEMEFLGFRGGISIGRGRKATERNRLTTPRATTETQTMEARLRTIKVTTSMTSSSQGQLYKMGRSY